MVVTPEEKDMVKKKFDGFMAYVRELASESASREYYRVWLDSIQTAFDGDGIVTGDYMSRSDRLGLRWHSNKMSEPLFKMVIIQAAVEIMFHTNHSEGQMRQPWVEEVDRLLMSALEPIAKGDIILEMQGFRDAPVTEAFVRDHFRCLCGASGRWKVKIEKSPIGNRSILLRATMITSPVRDPYKISFNIMDAPHPVVIDKDGNALLYPDIRMQE